MFTEWNTSNSPYLTYRLSPILIKIPAEILWKLKTILKF